MTGTLRGLNIHRGTFAFVTKYPKLHMPAIKVADMDLTDPTSSKCLLDGEFVRVSEAFSESGAAVAGSRRAYQIVTGDLPTPTINIGGADSITGYIVLSDGGRAADVRTEYVPHHGRPGRSDLQFSGSIPCVLDEDYEFNTRLVDTGESYVVGTKVFAWVIQNADLPAQVRAETSRDVVGLVPDTYIASLADEGINGTKLPYVGVCTSSKDANGWIRVRKVPGIWTISGALPE